MINAVILGSGTGSNAEAILEAEAAGKLGSARIVGILADKPQARILTLGERFGKPSAYVDPGPFKTKLSPEQEQAYVAQIRAWGGDFVVLAGFMRVVKQPLLDAFEGRMINLHPSLLPKYPGLHSIQRSLEAGDSETGCTVHWVNAGVDEGEIIAQARVPIEQGESLESVEAKVHAAEHKLLPSVIAELSTKL